VVDDEPMVGRAVARVLGGQHEVIVVHGGQEALTALAHGERFDLILCDLMMPAMSGMELYERIAALSPGLCGRFVFVSGGSMSAQVTAFLERVDCPRLNKPFDPAELRALVARALAATDG